MQETLVGYLVWEYPICHWATKTVLQLLNLCSRSWEPGLLRPQAAITEAFWNPEAALCNKRSHHNEKPTYRQYSESNPQLTPTKEKPMQQQRPHTSKRK